MIQRISSVLKHLYYVVESLIITGENKQFKDTNPLTDFSNLLKCKADHTSGMIISLK